MKKFLVVSYDNNEQQWFWDFVNADSQEKAEQLVEKCRPYVQGADGIELKDLRSMTEKLKNMSKEKIKENFYEVTR
jgi:hypothetical protein